MKEILFGFLLLKVFKKSYLSQWSLWSQDTQAVKVLIFHNKNQKREEALALDVHFFQSISLFICCWN